MSLYKDLRPSPSVNVLPSNRSLITADSRYRKNFKDDIENPYNFICKCSSNIVGKQIIYQKLYWNQPLYCHNNASSELRFQFDGDNTNTYVVYATPFRMFLDYDGNPVGQPFTEPQVASYCDMMTQAFNGDIRNLNTNLQKVNQGADQGFLYRGTDKVSILFRYSASQGFVICFQTPLTPGQPPYTIRLLPCDYIQNAHYVHGFGIYVDGMNGYVPRDTWTTSYFSDDTPNLLPFRYVTIRSDELTKDRRLISFQNASGGKFQNELAILSLNKNYTGVYHTETVGDDATVISKRDDYQPVEFEIQITDENGNIIRCDNPIQNLLSSKDVLEIIKQSYLFDFPFRGDSLFTNLLLFGEIAYSIPGTLGASPRYLDAVQIAKPVPDGVDNATGGTPVLYRAATFLVSSSSTIDFFVGVTSATINVGAMPVIINPVKKASFSYGVGIQSIYLAGIEDTVYSQYPQNYLGKTGAPYYSPPSLGDPQVSLFSWNPMYAPQIGVSMDALIQNVYVDPAYPSNNSHIYYAMYSVTIQKWVMAGWTGRTIDFTELGTSYFYYTDPLTTLTMNTTIPKEEMNQTHQCILCICPVQNRSSAPTNYQNMWLNNFFTFNYKFSRDPIVRIANLSSFGPTQSTGYVPPVTKTYLFGDPLCSARCDELIHELGVIIDRN